MNILYLHNLNPSVSPSNFPLSLLPLVFMTTFIIITFLKDTESHAGCLYVHMFRAYQLGVDKLQLNPEENASPLSQWKQDAYNSSSLHPHWQVNGCACLIQATISLKACAVTPLLYLEDGIILSSFWYPGLQYIQFN